MKVSGKEYRMRLMDLSNSTMQLIMSLQKKETYKEANAIVAETDNSEEEVIRKLTALKKQYEEYLRRKNLSTNNKKESTKKS